MLKKKDCLMFDEQKAVFFVVYRKTSSILQGFLQVQEVLPVLF